MPANFESGVFTDNEPAWHGAGVVLPDEVVSLETAFEHSPELASEVMFKPVWTTGRNGRILIPGKQATVRKYDDLPLGIVGSKYHILQNKDAFGIVQDILDLGNEASIKTAGTLAGGTISWFLIRVPSNDIQIGSDESEKIASFLLIQNSFDGKTKVKIATVNVRVVCSNTLALALGQALTNFEIKHYSNMEGRIQEAREALQISFRYNDEFEKALTGLLDTPMTPSGAGKFLSELFPCDEDKEGRGRTLAHNKRDEIVNAISYVPDLSNLKGTAYGWLQAVSYVNDHVRKAPKSEISTEGEAQFAKALNPDNLTNRAFALLTDKALVAA